MIESRTTRRSFQKTVGLGAASLAMGSAASGQTIDKTLPNIVFTLADYLGYGDIACYNPESKIPTPNLDKLTKQGMLFTDAHSPSTVCTPTRYSVLTGRMAFRQGMRGVFTGVGGPCMIEKTRLSLPQMLKNKGYATGGFGKWHIGMTFFDKEGKPICQNGLAAVKRIDYSRKIPDAPGQLYNLETDPGETTNLYFKHPKIVKDLKARLEGFKSSGRSAPKRK